MTDIDALTPSHPAQTCPVFRIPELLSILAKFMDPSSLASLIQTCKAMSVLEPFLYQDLRACIPFCPIQERHGKHVRKICARVQNGDWGCLGEMEVDPVGDEEGFDYEKEKEKESKRLAVLSEWAEKVPGLTHVVAYYDSMGCFREIREFLQRLRNPDKIVSFVVVNNTRHCLADSLMDWIKKLKNVEEVRLAKIAESGFDTLNEVGKGIRRLHVSAFVANRTRKVGDGPCLKGLVALEELLMAGFQFKRTLVGLLGLPHPDKMRKLRVVVYKWKIGDEDDVGEMEGKLRERFPNAVVKVEVGDGVGILGDLVNPFEVDLFDKRQVREVE
ncbi:hypothetical protein HDU97_010399 [Phlyctochytrium planicorne]|nr:hypothetical protein HDU97_010399 [Phlyctochytrium planicorne]